MNNTIINITNLSYWYSKNVQTLFDINLSVKEGTIYGFLGPNGSGKTTTIGLLLGLLTTEKGSIEIFGKNIAENRTDILRRIGSLIEVPSLYSHLTATENLAVYRKVYDVTNNRIQEVLKIVGLQDSGKKIVKKFSLGMKQRLSIALALLPNPALLILDEPTNGLDPGGIIELRELIKNLNQQLGMTIMVSSHMLAEVEKMVSHVGIIYKGKMLFQGTIPELHAYQRRDARLFIRTSDNEAAYTLLQKHQPVRIGETIAIPFSHMDEVAMINRTLIQNELDVFLLNPKENDLEQLFINLTTQPS